MIHLPDIQKQIHTELERLAEAYPGQQVDIWTCRHPEGPIIKFTAFVHGSTELGLTSHSKTDDTPFLAVNAFLAAFPPAELDNQRLEEIASLEDRISQLRSLIKYTPEKVL